jgi:hypothetical protein
VAGPVPVPSYGWADPRVVVLVGHSVTFSVATSVVPFVGLIQAPLEALQGVDGGGDAFPLSQFGRSHGHFGGSYRTYHA